MKPRYILVLALALAGCTKPPHSATLSAEQAGTLAQRLANEKAQTLYNCQPFRDGPPAEWVAGYWVWSDLRAHGGGDIEATVEFAADGAGPKVNVVLIDSRPLLPTLRQPSNEHVR